MHEPPQPTELAAVNQLGQDEFVALLGQVFEHSPWIARRAYAWRPFAGVAQLHAAMNAVIAYASNEEQLRLLRAHPELAGREARAGELTAASTAEQASAGLSALSAGEMARVHRLNAEYRAKFGYPFIIAVLQNTKDQIFEQWHRRLANAADEELTTALRQVAIIGRIRLEGLLRE